MPNRDRFRQFLLLLGRTLYLVVLCVLSPVSFFTTFIGFTTIFDGWCAVLAAVGLQSAMIAAWLFFGHNEHPQRRVAWLGVGLFAMVLSITFSFVGLRFSYETHVWMREQPIRNRANFDTQRGQLQEAAARLRGLALVQVDNLMMTHQSMRNLAALSQDARRRKAAEYWMLIRDLKKQLNRVSIGVHPKRDEVENIEAKIHSDERLWSLAQANAETLNLEILRQKEALRPLNDLRERIRSYTPRFSEVKENDGTGQPNWTGLRHEYDQLTDLIDETPGSQEFHATIHSIIPPAPSPQILATTGEVFEGEGHPLKQALQPLAHMKPVYVFLFLLAVSFDAIPLLFTWAMRPKLRTVPQAIFAMGNWMRRVRLALESVEGTLPFTWRSIRSVLFASNIQRTGHPSVLEFEDAIAREELRLDAALQKLVLPVALRELITLEFSYLRTRVIGIASERAAQFEKLALNAYERCVAAVRNANTLDEATRAELLRFLTEQVGRLNATTSRYKTDETKLDGAETDQEQEARTEQRQKEQSDAPESAATSNIGESVPSTDFNDSQT